MSTVIRLENVSKRFGGRTALDQVSYEVPPGVVFALLGENGAGKTTTIRTLLGLEQPDAGRAEVLGRDSRRAGIEIRRQIGYVPERPVLYEWMTVSQIGWFASGFYGDSFLKRYLDLCASFRLPLERKYKALSKGMRAQVSLSLAMANDPQLLILDEPTSGLDTLVRRSFLESMVDVAASGRTVFLSSHQIHEVERVADIVAIMNRGKVLVCESLESLKARLEQWTVTLINGTVDLPPIDAQILHRERDRLSARLTLSNPSAEELCRLREHPAVLQVDIDVPSLEEIFVMYLQRGEAPSHGELPGAGEAGEAAPSETPTSERANG